MGRSTRRGPWLPQEDNTLLHLVHLSGPNNWVRISQHMQHRSPKQCRERYHQNLKPTLNHDPITTDEGERIEQLVQEIGKRWAEIARRLGNRSDNAVKNWWNGSMNRRRRSTPHGVGRVGPRQYPISAAGIPPRSHSSNLLHPHHHVHHLLSESQPLRLYEQALKTENASPPVEHCTSTSSTSIITHAYPSHRSATTAPSCERKPLKLEFHERASVRPSLPSPNMLDLAGSSSLLRYSQGPYSGSRTCQHGLSSSSSSSSSGSEQRMEGSLPRLMDLPAISPATTEFSSTGSVPRPPSLVSDTLSHYSISPKTVSSPPPPPPLLGGSRAGLGPLGQNYMDSRSGKRLGYEGDESPYHGSAFNESGSDDFTLDPRPNLHSVTRVDDQFSLMDKEKDSRMSVSRLLD